MEPIDVEPSDDVQKAAWIMPRMRPFNEYVAGSVVPKGFEAYARIDHEREGGLPEPIAIALVGVLAEHTTSRGQCWMALWNGYGYVDTGSQGRSWQVLFASTEQLQAPPQSTPPMRIPPQRPASAPRVQLPNRDYVLYRGKLSHVPGWMDGPNLWWPDDHAWCVASEIDLPWTYVGGTRNLVDELVANSRIGSRIADIGESITADAQNSGSY